LNFLLDMNICSAAIRSDRRLFSRFVQHAGRLSTSRLVVAELYAWAYSKEEPDRTIRAMEILFAEDEIAEFDQECAETFGMLKARLGRTGVTVSPIDLLIASSAIAHDLTLVTHNTRDFTSIPGLSLADWLLS
jgi:tRNA(fMet)-specific endonuclease VapC